MGRLKIAIACGFLLSAWQCRPAVAQTAESLSQALQARIRLANTLYDQGNLVAALAEYRRIFVESGRTPLLFNIGKICAALDRAVEAVAELNKLLAAPADTPPNRLAEAQRIRDEQQARIGRLQIKTRIPATIEIDSVAVGETSVKVVADLPPDVKVETLGAGEGTTYWLKQPVELANGTHFVAALAPGHVPLRKQVEIAGNVAKDIELPLQPAKGELANIRVKTSLPGAEVVLDDALVGRTPLPVTLPVEAGTHVVTLRRPGYRSVTQQRALVPGQSWEVDSVLEEDAYEAGAIGQLVLEESEPGASVAVDGKVRKALDGNLRLPAGPHDVEITHSAFLPYRAQVDIEAGRTRRLRVELEPTAEIRHAKIEQAKGQRWRAWGTLAAGAVITGGGALYLRSALSNRDQVNRDFDEVQAQFAPGGECDPKGNLNNTTRAQCDAKKDRVNSATTTADRKVLGGYIATGVGAAVLLTGAILVLTVDDVSRYERYRDDPSSIELGTLTGSPNPPATLRSRQSRLASHAIVWLGWATPSGGGVSVAGRF
jgi:hypothetical protein